LAAELVDGHNRRRIASSHTPTIGFALDTNKQKDAVWAPIFAGYGPVQRWLAEKQPDVLFFIFNDHITSFFFDHYSHFALGVGDQILGRGRGRRRAQVASDQGAPRARTARGDRPRRGRVHMSYFQGKGLGSRLLLAAVAVVAA